MHRQRPIMIVEDDQVDIMTVQRAFADVRCSNPLIFCKNGLEALEMLETPELIQNPPCLMLLDLNMPRMNGVEFLQVIDQRKELRKFPVIVLSTSNQEADVVHSFRYGVAGYMVKPVDYKKFVAILEKISSYWSVSLIPE